MKRWAIIGAIVLLTSVVGSALVPARGECVWCPTYKCYGPNSCGMSCFCVIGPGSSGGHCYAIQ